MTFKGSLGLYKRTSKNLFSRWLSIMSFFSTDWSNLSATARTNFILNPEPVKWQSAFKCCKDFDRSLQLLARAPSNFQKQPDEWTWDGRKTTHSSHPFLYQRSFPSSECAPSKRSIFRACRYQCSLSCQQSIRHFAVFLFLLGAYNQRLSEEKRQALIFLAS